MKAWSFFTVIVFTLLASNVGTAQQRRPRDSNPFESIVPANLAEDVGRVELATVANDEEDDDLPVPLTAPPPPEPETPAWGQYLTPSPAPVASPPIHYNLISPPRGYVQQSQNQDYQAIIADPDAMLSGDAHFDSRVNIFRPDGMAPIGVFGDHTLPAGSTFISYRYLQNTFDQNYNGTHRIGIPTSYPQAPTHMLQDSQIALVEYGATQDFTIQAYLPFQHNAINLYSTTGNSLASFTNPGDIRITGLYVLSRGQGSQGHLNLGLSIPVGFLEQVTGTGGTPNPPTAVPYQLQTSSGSYSLLLGYTYRKQTQNWTFGGQANAVIPTGMNSLDFEVGNQFQLTGWASRRLNDRWSTSARLDGRIIQNIHGADPRLSVTDSPINLPNTQASQTLNGLLGVNYLLTRPGHRLSEQRLFLESGIPLYEWYAGPQLGLSWILNAGWGMTF